MCGVHHRSRIFLPVLILDYKVRPPGDDWLAVVILPGHGGRHGLIHAGGHCADNLIVVHDAGFVTKLTNKFRPIFSANK